MEFAIHRLGTVDSTSERAFDALARGAARDGDVFVARGQTRGRGRRGASWHSPEGEGLYFSVAILARAPIPPAALTMAAGVAMRAALADLGLARAQLKWPNDLVCDGAKLCGCLVETRGLDPERPHYVLGIGLNVRQREFPPELLAERAVTSLALCGVECDCERALDAALSRLAERLDEARAAPESTCAAYVAAAELSGRAVRLLGPDGALEGRLVGLSLARGVELECADRRRVALALEHVRALEPQ